MDDAQISMNLEYAIVDGRQIRYAASRRTDSPQLLLVNPHPQSILTYTNWWQRLCARFDVVAVDLPNHGGSDADKTVISVSQQAAFLLKIFDHFGLKQPHYVGPDIGTPLGLRFMADNPGRLRSAIIGDAAAVGKIEGELLFRLNIHSRIARLATLSGGGAIGGRIYTYVANRVGYKRTKKPNKVLLQDYLRSSTTLAKLSNQMEFLASYVTEVPELTKVVGTINTPVLVLHGERDTFVGVGNSRRLADALPNSEFGIIAEAGHYSWEDNPEPYLAHVLRWIDKAEAETNS